MRILYNYQIIRYFPHINSDEFFNVGIHLANSEKNILYFINDEHLGKLLQFPSIDKKYLISFIELLNKEKNISQWYGNYLRFSEKRVLRSSEAFETVLANLYEDYIGYKFHTKEKIDIIEVIKEKTRKLVSNEFKKYLDLELNTVFDFHIIDKNKKKDYYSSLGSIRNRENINSVLWQVEDSQVVSNNGFHFLNIYNPKDENIEVANNILYKNKLTIIQIIKAKNTLWDISSFF